MAEFDRVVFKLEADLSALKRGLNQAQATVATSGGRMSRTFDGFNRTIGTTTRAVFNLRTAFLALGVGIAAREFVKAADTFKLMDARLRIVTRSTAELKTATRELFKIAQETRSSYEATVELYARVARGTRELGLAQEDLLTITSLVNKTIQVSGATAQEASAGVIQFSQALSSSRFSGDELRSVLEQMTRLGQAIADGIGVPLGKLRELGQQGKLTTEVVTKALLSQRDVIEKEFAKLPRTVGQALTQLRNDLLLVAGETDKTSGATSELIATIDELRKIVVSPEFKEGLSNLVGFMVDLGKFAVENRAEIAGLASAMIAMAIATRVAAAVPLPKTLRGLLPLLAGAAAGVIAYAKATEGATEATDEFAGRSVTSLQDELEELQGLASQILNDAQREFTGSTETDILRAIALIFPIPPGREDEIADVIAERIKLIQEKIVEKTKSGGKLGSADVDLGLEKRAAELVAALQKAVEPTKKMQAELDALELAAIDTADILDPLLRQAIEDVLKAFEKPALDKAKKAFDEITTSLEGQNASLRLQIAGQEESAELLEAELDARKRIGEKIAPAMVVTIREQTAEQIKLRKELEKITEAAEEWKRIWENAADSIQGSLRDAFRDALDGSIENFEDFADRVKNLMFDVAADIAAALVFQPLVGGIVSSLGIPTATSAGSGLFGNPLSSVGSLLNLGGLFGGSTAIAGGVGGSIAGGVGGSIAGGVGGSIAGGAGITAAGLGLSSLLGPLAIAGIAGTLAFSLLGNKRPSIGPNQSTFLAVDASGNIVPAGGSADNAGNVATSNAQVAQIAAQFNQLIAAIGGTFDISKLSQGPAGGILGNIGNIPGVGGEGPGDFVITGSDLLSGNINRQSIGTIADAFTLLLNDAISTGAFKVDPDALRTFLGGGIEAVEAERFAEAMKVAVAAAKEFTRAAESLAQSAQILLDTAESSLFGSLSPLSPADRLTEARGAFTRASQLALTGDLDATRRLNSLFNEFVSASRAFNASSSAFVQDFNSARQTLLNVATAQQNLADQALANAVAVVAAVPPIKVPPPPALVAAPAPAPAPPAAPIPPTDSGLARFLGGAEGGTFFNDQGIEIFSHGGLVTSPTLAILGDSGPELVIPLGGKNALFGGIHDFASIGGPQGSPLDFSVGDNPFGMLSTNATVARDVANAVKGLENAADDSTDGLESVANASELEAALSAVARAASKEASAAAKEASRDLNSMASAANQVTASLKGQLEAVRGFQQSLNATEQALLAKTPEFSGLFDFQNAKIAQEQAARSAQAPAPSNPNTSSSDFIGQSNQLASERDFAFTGFVNAKTGGGVGGVSGAGKESGTFAGFIDAEGNFLGLSLGSIGAPDSGAFGGSVGAGGGTGTGGGLGVGPGGTSPLALGGIRGPRQPGIFGEGSMPEAAIPLPSGGMIRIAKVDLGGDIRAIVAELRATRAQDLRLMERVIIRLEGVEGANTELTKKVSRLLNRDMPKVA